MSRQCCDSKTAYVALNARERFASSPKEEYLTLTLIIDGKALLNINGSMAMTIAPCLLLSSWQDRIALVEDHLFAAKSFSFHPTLINKCLTLENLSRNDFQAPSDEHDHNLISPFFVRKELGGGIMKPLPQSFLRICEWFDAADRESQSKSDEQWLHRVRRYLFQILLELENGNTNGANPASDQFIVDAALEYVHANFSTELSLEVLCKLVHINRTSLTRKFKARTGRTPIDYLLRHRLHIACELLTHSSLSIGKIAEMTGFKYESYFTRQFAAKIGSTPTRYRQNDGFETLNTKASGTVDEF